LKKANAVVNLAGNPVTPPWTSRKKKAMVQSRVDTTRCVAQAMEPGQTLVNASAIGYYGFCGEDILTEEAPCGHDFLSSLCHRWEAEASSAQERGTRVAIGRFGVVLGRGGVIEDMARMLRNFLGARFGSGEQWFSWIHIQDLIRAIEFCMERGEIQGSCNICSPYPVRNETLMRTLARTLGISPGLPIPASVLRFVLGEFASIVLESQRVHPAKLLRCGFSFEYPLLEGALEHLLERMLEEPSRRFW
jgi:hypothetical protein